MSSDNLPSDYRDYPTAYVGQPKRSPSDDFSTFRDPSKPDAAPGRQNAEDALDADKPAGQGGSGSPVPVSKKRRVIRWRRAQ